MYFNRFESLKSYTNRHTHMIAVDQSLTSTQNNWSTSIDIPTWTYLHRYICNMCICTADCIWSVIQDQSRILISLVSFQLSERDLENKIHDWDWRMKKRHSWCNRLYIHICKYLSISLNCWNISINIYVQMHIKKNACIFRKCVLYTHLQMLEHIIWNCCPVYLFITMNCIHIYENMYMWIYICMIYIYMWICIHKLHIYKYIYVYINVYVCIYKYICMYTYTNIYMYIYDISPTQTVAYIYIYINTYIWQNIYVWYVCMCDIYMYVYVHIYIYIYISLFHTNTHTHTFTLSVKLHIYSAFHP